MQVAECTHATGYGILSWWTRAPNQLDPVTNILLIFDIPSWILFFLSVVSVALFLVFASWIGRHYNLKTNLDNVVLIPFRLVG